MAILALLLVGCMRVALVPYVFSASADGDTKPFYVTLEIQNPKLNGAGQPVGEYTWYGNWDGGLTTGSQPSVEVEVCCAMESPILFSYTWTDGRDSQSGQLLFKWEEEAPDDPCKPVLPDPCKPVLPDPCLPDPCVPDPCVPDPCTPPCPPDPCNPMPPCVTWETWIIEVQVPVCQYPLYKVVVDCNGGYLYWDPYLAKWWYPWEVE